MKLNPEQLVVSSFETAAPRDTFDGNVQGTQAPFCPTPAMQCFVCPAPSSPEDGC